MAFLTFQDQHALCQDITGDDSSDRLTGFKRDLNIASGILRHELSRFIFEETREITSVADQQGYELPSRAVRVSVVVYDDGTNEYYMEEVPDRKLWRQMNIDSSNSSDIPAFYFVDKDKVYLFPTPSSAGDTIRLYVEETYREMTLDDYTTGNVTTLANADTTVTGSGTTWDNTSNIKPDGWFRVDSDGVWYEIDSVTNDTTLDLVKNYEGTAISGGSESYTIGEQALGRYEDLHILPVYYALAQYYALREIRSREREYRGLWLSGKERALETYGKRNSSAVIPSGRRRAITVSNRFPTLTE